MIFGTSELHAPQPVGSFYELKSIKGYYNDLRLKVLNDKKHLNDIEYIPSFISDDGIKTKFPITVLQYALGCCDLYFETQNILYAKQAKYCADYIASIINDDGSIPCMAFLKNVKNVNSSMCQGEAVSLFARIYSLFSEERYKKLAISAADFMFQNISSNGVSDDSFALYEYPEKPLVLNGWIFSLFGLYDAYLLTHDQKYITYFEKSLACLKKSIHLFLINNYWSYYDLGNNIASPFYNDLHISLLESLSKMSGVEFFEEISILKKGSENKRIRRKMFWKKARQKIKR